MKILMILNYGWEFGGGETHVLTLRSELSSIGHNVVIFTSNDSLNKRHFSNYEFKKIKKIPFRFFAMIFNIRSLKKLKEIIKYEKPDIIHIHSISGQVSPSIFLASKEIPTVMTIHNSGFSSYGLGRISLSNLEQRIRNFLWRKLKNAKYYIFPSNFMNSYFKEYKLNNAITIHNGIKLFKFSKIKNFQSLLYVGRLTTEKGVHYLLKAMPQIIKEFPNIKLTIIGDGPERENFKKQVEKLKLNNKIIFSGEIEHSKIEKEYMESSVVIVPSICPESFCLIGPEAMSIGRPVIASNVGGISEWLEDGKTGYLIPPKNLEAIAEKVIKLLLNPKLMQEMGRAGRKKAEKEFDIRNYAKEIEKIYKKAIRENKN